MNPFSTHAPRSLRGVIWMAVAVVVAAGGLAAASLLPEGNPLHASAFVVSLAGKYLSYAMLALAVDLVWGFAGILTLGHAAFFALGGMPWACTSCARSGRGAFMATPACRIS
ncbi:hypothetical protein RI056_16940 [Komagataeibacter nataicola]|uniref:hypothetical protein n=1 Tax=Komagataeibacter nataicola TaxID=265960 RepID=UPI0028A58D07|nr:hypothetical protein [Komagataeibacter nataicola]WNM08501.1 hypothetical protein RI056_16940 [Komagataeibacter nataicola]